MGRTVIPRGFIATVTALTLAVSPLAGLPVVHAASATAGIAAIEEWSVPSHPEIQGQWYLGQTVEIATGTVWARGNTFSYQWLQNGQPIAGATAKSLTLGTANLGRQIGAVLTITEPNGTINTEVLDSLLVEKLVLVGQGLPPLRGAVRVGSKLTAPSFDWSIETSGGQHGLGIEVPNDIKLDYQWWVDNVPVKGATGRNFTPRQADFNKSIVLRVTANHPHFASGKGQAESAYIDLGILAAPAPTIGGRVKVGHQLTANAGAWPMGTKLSFQWYANGKAIQGAKDRSFVPFAEQASKKLTVKVTGTLSGYSAASRTSAATAPAAASPYVKSSIPTISGTARIGSKLTAKPGAWSKGAKLAYQWYAGGTPIAKATKSTFTPGLEQRYARISVRVTGSLIGYAMVSKASKAAEETRGGSVTGPHPKLTGSYKVGSTLTAHAGKWTPGAKLSYQWYTMDSPGDDTTRPTSVKGATTPTFKITSAERGKRIWVEIHGSKKGYSGWARTSFWWAKTVPATPMSATTPTISGTAKTGHTLRANAGRWTTGTKLGYQWQANGQTVRGATKSTLKLPSSLRGKKITIRVTGTKAGYTTVSKSSKATRAILR